MSDSAAGSTSKTDESPPTISLPLFLEQTVLIAKLEKEKEILLNRIAELKRELLFAGLGIRVVDVDK